MICFDFQNIKTKSIGGKEMKKVNVAVVGATGMVGNTFLKVLEERSFPIDKFYVFASQKSAGSEITFNDKQYIVEELTEQSFDRDIDIALFSAGGDISMKYAPIAASKGVIVVDNSSTWRMDPKVPLVVPEVNPNDVEWNKGIIANPNCSTIQAVVALKPLHEKYKIKRIIYSTYQAVSGSGVKGVSDLEEGLKGNPHKFYAHPIANNCLPHIDVFMENGYTKEEMKMIEETKKIIGDQNLKITATTVRVPVFNSHSESVNVEFYNDFDLNELRELLKNSPGIVIQDDVANNVYPLAASATGKDEVFIGRIRRDDSVDNGVNMWVVSDNIRKGAATNAVQIAELLIEKQLV
jgi:aspartate-semialdehyde dehydrogenase